MDGAGKTTKELIVIGVMEALGTLILFTSINFCEGNIFVVISGIISGAVISGRVSGAHFNGSITLAIMVA
jgi:hypothetical protein